MPADLTPEAEGVRSELAPDNVFELLVHVANTTDLEMRITLHVRGQMLTGKLISGATYWSESAADLRERASGPSMLVETTAASMERVADEYRKAYAEEAFEEDGAMSAFVHLREARTISPLGPIPTDGALWRGRLASVDGFSLGELRARSSLESSM